MDNAGKNLKKLHSELQKAAKLIEQKKSIAPLTAEGDFSTLNDTKSFLVKCDKVLKKHTAKKSIIRVIHHLACSGGTLISKCLSALPNTYLLSEVHPTTTLHVNGKSKFNPSDLITLARYAKIPNLDELAWDIFKSNVKIASKHVEGLGGYLVLRDHSHSDFCVGDKYVKTSSIAEYLSSDFDVLSIASVRHPVDCYLSMKLKNWLHFEPPTFEEYCSRYLSFIEQFSSEQIFKYEDFVTQSEVEMELISKKLKLPYNGSFIDTFSSFDVTGDSGRGGDVIETKSRRELSKDFLQEVESSSSYSLLLKKLKYESVREGN